MNQPGVNGHSDQQEGTNSSPITEENDFGSQKAPDRAESDELEANASVLVPRSSNRLIGSSEVWQIDHTEVDVLLVANLES